MHKVLIVDDDWLILEDICNLINWENCGFQAPLTAQSAGQALKILEEIPVELVITDISMPEISGVELILQAKQICPDIVFAVLSNYDDFLYVKEAMKAGAVEYLLKYEIERENLKKFLMQMEKEIQAKKRSMQEQEQLFQMQKKMPPVGGLPISKGYYYALPVLVMGVIMLVMSAYKAIAFVITGDESICVPVEKEGGGLLD